MKWWIDGRESDAVIVQRTSKTTKLKKDGRTATLFKEHKGYMNVRKMTNSMLKQKAEAFGAVLYSCAKKQPKRKFHALYDKVYRPDILKHAWIKVKSNKGSAGVDHITIEYIMNEYGESRMRETSRTV